MAQIFKTIEQPIDCPQNQLNDCCTTASLRDRPLPEKNKIICKSLGNNMSYEINENQIISISDQRN